LRPCLPPAPPEESFVPVCSSSPFCNPKPAVFSEKNWDGGEGGFLLFYWVFEGCFGKSGVQNVVFGW
jgi:hypothetical protein